MNAIEKARVVAPDANSSIPEVDSLGPKVKRGLNCILSIEVDTSRVDRRSVVGLFIDSIPDLSLATPPGDSVQRSGAIPEECPSTGSFRTLEVR